MPHRLRIPYLALLLILVLNIASLALAEKDCSFTHTNRDCTLTLDRNSFVFPPTLQMYPGAVVTVNIKNGRNFEAYTLDKAAGQATVRSDVASSVLGNLNTILAAASSLGAASASPVPPAQSQSKGPLAEKVEKKDPCIADPNGIECLTGTLPQVLKTVCEKNPQSPECRIGVIYQALKREQEIQDTAAQKQSTDQANALNATKDVCDNPKDLNNNLSQFSSERCMLLALHIASKAVLAASTSPSEKLYQELQSFLTPDAQPIQGTPVKPADLLLELCGGDLGPDGKPRLPDSDHPCALDSNNGNSLIHKLAESSAFAASVLSKLTKPPSTVNVPSGATYTPPTQAVLNAMQLVTEEQAALDAIRKDLEGYAARIQDLVNPPADHPIIASGVIGSGAIQEVGKIEDKGKDYKVIRSVNYSLNRLNLITNSLEAANDGSKKALIVTINVVYGQAIWEASSGVAVAFRPIRTFSVAPVISQAGLQTGSYISQNKAGPEVVPFAAADLRLGDDFDFAGWRGAFYATAGVGYNTSQESADFLVGPSISWRGILLSALCDFGNGTRLGQGLTVGESLPGTPASGTTPYTPTTISTLPTTNHLVPAFTIGVSVRIPGISGR